MCFEAGDLEGFFENGEIGLHIVAHDGTILRANRAELNLLGYAADDYVGHPIADFHVDRIAAEDRTRSLFLQRAIPERLPSFPVR